MKRDVGMVAEPFWRAAYATLVEQYKLIERLLQERMNDLDQERRRGDALEAELQYHKKRYEDMQIDCIARLKALGLSDQDLEEFQAYWTSQQQSLM